MLSTNALAQMNRLRDELDRVFGVEGSHWNRPSAFPPVNVWEDENSFLLEAELPGMKIEDLEIYVQEGNQLSIKGTRTPSEVDGAKLRRRERTFGDFQRNFQLETDVNVNAVKADFHHGVLRVTLPKSESVKPKKIEINAAGSGGDVV